MFISTAASSLATGLLLILLLALSLRLVRLRQRLGHFERDLAGLRAAAARSKETEAQEAALNKLMVDLTRLTERLQTGRDVRQVPKVLVHLVQRTFDAEKVVVLFARGDGEEPTTKQQLVVGATSAGAVERSQNEVLHFGEGELGLVAELQEAVDRADLQSHRAARHATVPGLRSFRTELAAPMVVGGRTFGLVGLSGVGRHFTHEKTILTLIAQTAGFGLHSAASLSELKNQADLDGLTGILNRRALIERLDELVREAIRSGQTVGLFMFDVDRFKHYNDRNGHGAGDALLQKLCTLVSRSVRPEDAFGRVGGEEFVVATPNQSVASTYGLAEKVRRAIGDHDFEHGAAQPLGSLTVSGGVAVLPGHARDAKELLEQADKALYRAKAAGRNRVEIAVPEPSTAA